MCLFVFSYFPLPREREIERKGKERRKKNELLTGGPRVLGLDVDDLLFHVGGAPHRRDGPGGRRERGLEVHGLGRGEEVVGKPAASFFFFFSPNQIKSDFFFLFRKKKGKKRAETGKTKKKKETKNAPVEGQAARHVEREPADHQREEFQDRLRLLLGRVVLLRRGDNKRWREKRERERK